MGQWFAMLVRAVMWAYCSCLLSNLVKIAPVLLSVSEAMEYYAKIGFEKIKNGFIIKRAR